MIVFVSPILSIIKYVIMNKGDYMSKIERLKKFIKENELDAILVSNPYNVFYYSNFKGTNGRLLVSKENNYLITDFRYVSQAKKQAKDFDVVETTSEETLDVVINKLRKKHKLYKLGLEGDFITRNDWLDFEKKLKSRLFDVNIDFLREVKLDDEVVKIKKAIEIAEEAFKEVLKEVKVGKSEKEIARSLEFKMLNKGAEAIAFDTIVASGHRGALPHGIASDKLIQNNEMITFDFGCVYEGYCSDMTRTIAIGEVDEELLNIYNIVLEANKLGISELAVNKDCQMVDKIVRDFISDKGYKENFGHGLGHSFGVEIHEDPRLNQVSTAKIKAGHILTVEPGIYVEGLGGVRIEDDILVKDGKIEVLTSLDKELILLEEEK